MNFNLLKDDSELEDVVVVGVWSIYYPYFYKALQPHLPSLVLDVGAATGDWIRYLKDKGVDCYGFDLKPQSKDVIKASATLIPFKDRTFGVVTMMEILEHIPRPQTFLVLAEAWRVLRDDGILFVTTPNDEGIRKKIRTFLNLGWCEAGDHCNLYTSESLRDQLYENGFQEICLHTFPLYIPFIGRSRLGLKLLYKLRKIGGNSNSFIIAHFRKDRLRQPIQRFHKMEIRVISNRYEKKFEIISNFGSVALGGVRGRCCANGGGLIFVS